MINGVLIMSQLLITFVVKFVITLILNKLFASSNYIPLRAG